MFGATTYELRYEVIEKSNFIVCSFSHATALKTAEFLTRNLKTFVTEKFEFQKEMENHDVIVIDGWNKDYIEIKDIMSIQEKTYTSIIIIGRLLEMDNMSKIAREVVSIGVNNEYHRCKEPFKKERTEKIKSSIHFLKKNYGESLVYSVNHEIIVNDKNFSLELPIYNDENDRLSYKDIISIIEKKRSEKEINSLHIDAGGSSCFPASDIDFRNYDPDEDDKDLEALQKARNQPMII